MLLEDKTSEEFRIMVVAPHPDDEVIAAGGLISRAVRMGISVEIVIVTSGETYPRAAEHLTNHKKLTPEDFYELGMIRQRESTNALSYLGIPVQNIVFLGFADTSLKFLLDEYWDKPCNIGGIGTTYCPYNSSVYNPGVVYTGKNLYRSMQTVIKSFRPTHIIYPHEKDTHDDHKATNRLIDQIVTRNHIQAVLLNYLVHYPQWPFPTGLYQDLDMPLPPSEDPQSWDKFILTEEEIKQKCQAILMYKSQLYTLNDFLLSFDRSSEIFARSHIISGQLHTSNGKTTH